MSTLHDDLTHLTADQPMQPVDRLSAVTRKAGRIRRTRAVIAGTASVAVLASAGALAFQRHEATTHFAHTSVTSWPDRSYAQDRAVADGAIADYRQNAENFREQVGSTQHWLFRGTVALPDHNDLYVASFVIEHEAREVVVTSTTRRSQVDAKGADLDHPNDPNMSSWVSHEVPVTKELDHVGLYIGYSGTDLATDPQTQVRSSDRRNKLFVLADPSARDLRWTQSPVPFTDAGTQRSYETGGVFHSNDGMFVGDAGTLVGPVSVAAIDSHGNVRNAGALASASGLDLAEPTLPEVPAGWAQHFAASGTSEQQSDGSWTGLGDFYDGGDYTPARPAVVVARCYGGGSLTFTMMGTNDKVLVRSTVACDGQSHEALRHVAPAHGYHLAVGNPDRLQALWYLGGTVG